MPITHLTDLVVSRLQTCGIYYDQTTPAFGVRIGKHKKAWVITRGSDRQRLTIGHYPTMSLADARREARQRLSQPVLPTARLTYREAYERYRIETLSKKKPRTQYDYRRVLERS